MWRARRMERQVDDGRPTVDDLVEVPASNQSGVGKNDLRARKHALQDGGCTEAVEVRVRHDAADLRKAGLHHASAG